MFLRSFFSIVLMFFLSPAFANAVKVEPLKVGMELAYPPFEMTNKDGKPSGVSVDLAYALGKYLGRPVEIENIAWAGLIPSLKTKKIDIIISSMTITKERAKVIDFSIPYADANLCILTYPNSGVKSINDLDQKGRVIAVKQGTTADVYATAHLKKAKLLIFNQVSSAILEVIQKRADAFIYGQLTVYRSWAKHKKTTVALLKPITNHPEHWGIALRKGQPKLKAKINTFIRQAKANGTFNRLANKYLKSTKKKFDELGIPFFF